MKQQPQLGMIVPQQSYNVGNPYYTSMPNTVPQYQQPVAPQQGGGLPINGLLNQGAKFALNKTGGTGLMNTAVTGVKSAINGVGSSMGLGTGSTAGALGSTTSLTGMLGPAALGYGLGGSIAGLTGGNPTGGSVGGALGGALGSYAAGTAGGMAAGAALGLGAQALNFVLPGLGILAGGVLGGLFGSSKPKNKISEFTSIIGKEGNLNLDPDFKAFGTKGMSGDIAQSMFGQASDYLTELKKATGLDFTDRRIRGGYDQKGGGYYYSATDSGAKGLDPNGEFTKDFKKITFGEGDTVNGLQQLADHLASSSGLGQDAIDKINKFTLQYSQKKQAQVNGLSGNTVPMVGGREINPNQKTFAQFVDDYKKQQQQGAA